MKKGSSFRRFVNPKMKRVCHSDVSLIRKLKGVRRYSEASLIRNGKKRVH